MDCSPEIKNEPENSQPTNSPGLLALAQAGSMIETHDQKMEGVEIPVDTSFENNTELPESQPEAANLNLNQFERMIDGCYSKIWSSMQSYIEQTSQRYLEGAKSIVGPGSSTLSSIQASVNEVDSHVHQVDRRFEEIEQKLAFMPNANEFAGLQENLAHVNDKLKKEQQEHSKLVAKFNKYECSLARVTNERDEARQELEKIRNATRSNALTTSSKVTDSAIIEAWKQLQYNIRSLAGSLAKDYPGTRFDHKFEERMRLVCSKYKSHFHHEDYRELLLRAYLWDIIVNDIFNGEANLWARQAGFHLKILKSNMFVGAEENGEGRYLEGVMQWLAQGSSLLNRLWGSDKDAIRQHTATETLRLRPFLGKDAYKRYKREIRLGDELRAIFNKAMELDNMFMSSKAYFSVNWTDSCLNTGRKHYYDEQFMEVEGNLRPLTPRSGVDFFISPILVKIGNADGENFDSKMLLAKAQVMCD